MLPLIILLSLLPSTVMACAATTPSTPINPCTACANPAILTDDIPGATNEPITFTSAVNAAGCQTLTVTCTTADVGSQIVFFWFQQGADRGTSQDVTTVSRTLVCDANSQLILTEPATGVPGVVDQVQCVSA